jgi:inner membrane protein
LKHPVFLKMMAVGGVLLMLIFGLALIGGIVRDRQVHREAATSSVAQSLAGSQTLIGPLLHRSCVETWDVTTGSDASQTRTEQRREFALTALPDDLNVTTGAAMEPRARGLHKVNTFALKAHLTARWADLASLQPQATVKNSRLQCDPPVLMVAVGDARGIRTARLRLDAQDRALKPGTLHRAYPRGVHATLPEATLQSGEPFTAEVALELAGTERFSVVPLAGTTAARFTSGWPHPSFDGRFLPTERTVGDQGFDAVWRLSALATTAPQDIAAGKPVCLGAAAEDSPAQKGCTDAFGVSFIDPVNPTR